MPLESWLWREDGTPALSPPPPPRTPRPASDSLQAEGGRRSPGKLRLQQGVDIVRTLLPSLLLAGYTAGSLLLLFALHTLPLYVGGCFQVGVCCYVCLHAFRIVKDTHVGVAI